MNTPLTSLVSLSSKMMKPFKNLIFLFTLFGLTVSQLNAAEDLIVQADGIAGPTAADPGETVTFDITVENISGDTDVTADFDVQVTIDGTTASGTTTFPAATTNIPQGGTAVVQVSVDLPNVAKNTFDVTAFADSADDIAEDDENNNTETEVAFISISEPPQIEITPPADNATVIPGTTITITTSVLDTDGVIAQVEFFVNNATIGTVTTFPFQLDFTVPSPGTLEISTTATDDSGVTADSDLVTLNSSVGSAPTVSIISPTSGESFIPGFNLDIIAEAADSDGLIEEVEFFINGVSIGNATTFPFGLFFQLPSPGSYQLTAIATDNAGNVGFSQTVNIEVVLGTPPVITLTSPSSGGSFIPGAELILAATANDPDGLVSEVEFFVNDSSVGTTTTAPFQSNFSLPSSGVYFIRATATDNSGNKTRSGSVVVSAGPPDNSTPRIIIDHPLPIGGGDTVNDVSVASSMFLNATAVDPDGFITEVRFFANGQLLGSTNQGLGDQYSLFFDPTQQGDFEFTAEAVDNFGNVGQAIPIPLDVGPVESLLPTGFMRPLSDLESTISVGESVELKVELNAGLLDISQVNYYANGVFIGTQDTDTPVESIGQVMSSFSVLPGSRIFPEPTPCRRVPSRSIQTDSLSITGLLLIPFL